MEILSSPSAVERDYSESRSEQIVGSSPALKSVLVEVERVAPTDASVLLLGETGTGKELIAHAIHNLSPRSERPFVKLDCAAIPFEMMESALFGHEIGAFPWARAQNIGRFEMADNGTLFLDEIGDLPLGLQPKLLRILQEREFERPGSSRTHRVNVRLLAATNRDLMHMVRQREFRSDLFYRLCGFPIMLPPLRERRQDIALLVSHFVEMFSGRMGKRIHHLPKEILSAFTAHSWPGNVRELRNLIERAVILSNDGVLPNPLPVSGPNPMIAISAESTLNDSSKASTRSNRSSGVLLNSLPKPEQHSLTTAHVPGHELGSANTLADLPIVFVLDDDVSVRESMEVLIHHEGWQPETFAFARDFLDRPRPFVPNCLVLDISLQDLDGLELQKRIVIERNETPIIFIAGHGDVSTSVQAMKAGAVEFLIKPLDDEALLSAIREALKRSSIAISREAEMRPIRECYASLSHRERQVMALVLSGLLNKQIGAELGISEITVKAHRGRVMQKMGAKSVIDLVRMAARLRSERTFATSGHLRPPAPAAATASSGCAMTVSSGSGRAALTTVSGRS
jgi:formate hydrogenlyase transcriptional activator